MLGLHSHAVEAAQARRAEANRKFAREAEQKAELASAQQGLPQPWRAMRSQTTGRVYFSKGDESQWIRPRALGSLDSQGYLAVSIFRPPTKGTDADTAPPPPWATPPNLTLAVPPLEYCADAYDTCDAEPCPHFGSEAGCFHGQAGLCQFSHADPNSVPRWATSCMPRLDTMTHGPYLNARDSPCGSTELVATLSGAVTLARRPMAASGSSPAASGTGHGRAGGMRNASTGVWGPMYPMSGRRVEWSAEWSS